MSPGTYLAKDVIRVSTGISNAYLVGTGGNWCLIDTGTDGYAGKLLEIAEYRFGRHSRPQAILLTHGHFDHAGSAAKLADHWRVKVYAHELELPFLTGKSKYPPADPTVGGFMSQVIRFFPNKAYDLGKRVQELNVRRLPSAMKGWECIPTPGHAPGHVSYFRERDRVLIAGDAFTTIDQDTMWGMLSKKPQVCRPPAYYTCDWGKAEESVQRLAQFEPALLAAGHGEPMAGSEARQQLWELADNFPAPAHGRYVYQPAITDENGIVLLPPPAPDPVKNVTLGVAALSGAGLVTAAVLRRRGFFNQSGRSESEDRLAPSLLGRPRSA